MIAAVGWLRGEAEALEFRLRPTVIVLAFTTIFLAPVYWKGEAYYELLRSLGSDEFLRDCRRMGFTHTAALRVVLPLALLVCLREPLRAYGLGFGNWHTGLKLTGAFYLLYVPCFVYLMLDESFTGHYAGVSNRYDGWGEFVRFEVTSVVVLMIAGEFFFRGFLLFGIERSYGAYAAILVHLIPYVYGHHTKPAIEAFGSIPVGFALAYLAIKTNSIWYGVLLHATIALGFNALLFARG